MEVVEEIRGAFTVETFMESIGPAAAGLVANRYLMARVTPMVQKVLPPNWVATGADVAIGAGILAAAGLVASPWKERLRVAGYTNMALAAVNALKALGVIGSSGKTVNVKGRPGQKYL